jgi:hypothetical protein
VTGLWRVEWVRTPGGRVAHAALAEVHPGINLDRAAGDVYGFGPQRSQVPVGEGLCQYGATADRPADGLRRCGSCELYLAGWELAVRRQIEEPLGALVLADAKRGDPAAWRLLRIVLREGDPP